MIIAYLQLISFSIYRQSVLIELIYTRLQRFLIPTYSDDGRPKLALPQPISLRKFRGPTGGILRISALSPFLRLTFEFVSPIFTPFILHLKNAFLKNFPLLNLKLSVAASKVDTYIMTLDDILYQCSFVISKGHISILGRGNYALVFKRKKSSCYPIPSQIGERVEVGEYRRPGEFSEVIKILGELAVG